MKYSNCLIEAIKAKIKNPKKVKIYLYPREINNNEIHFYWVENNTAYHFTKNNSKSVILFEGKVKSYDSNLFYSLMGHKMFKAGLDRKQAFELAKKYRLPLTEDDINDMYFNEEND